MKTERRTEYEIYWEILSFCRTGKTLTHIISRCNLNSRIVSPYIDFLSAKGYLSRLNEGERNLYETTQKANEYLTLFTKLYRELFDNSPQFKL
jgi:predicted transcriptional regulator